MKRGTAFGAVLALLLAPVLVRLLMAQSPPQGSAASFTVFPPALAYVGSVFNFSVTAFDPSNNAAKSYTGTVHFTSTDPQAVLPPDYTFTTGDSGTHMFSATLNTPGTQTITATDTANGAITGTSNPITVSATPPPPPPTFTLTDLGPLQITAAPAGATAFNTSGQVTGFRFENFPSPVCFAGGADRAFLWSNGVYTELGTLGGFSSFGYGINSAGQIVGSSDICPNGIETGQRAFIWQNGSMTALDLSTNSNDSSVAFAINSNGDVAGYTNHVGNSANPQAVIWKGGTAAGLAALQSLACQFTACQTRALAINDSGQAAGWGLGPFVSGRAGSYNASQAVMWDANGQSTGLGSLGNFWSDQANAINSKGDVAGYSQLDPGVYSSIVRAAVWKSGNPQNPQDLGTIPGFDPIFGSGVNITDNSSSAWGTNSKGEIVGISGYGSNAALLGNGGRAFLYLPTPAPGTGGQMYDLLSLLAPGTNWRRLEAAWAINDNNQILGVGIDPNQQEHGFLLTPIITPTTTTVSSSVNPSVFGQQVSFTATVTPTQSSPLTPSGNITLTDTFNGVSTDLGTVALSSGTAIFNTAGLGVGTHTITASYAGDNNFGSSTSSAVNQAVNQAATSTALAVSPNPANFGQGVTFTATVNVVAPGAGTPTGLVTFLDGTTTLGTGAVNTARTATFGTSSLAVGSYTVTASYSGDANFSGSASAATNLGVVLPAPAITSPASGFSTTIASATVNGTGTPGAGVAILDGATTVGTSTVSGAGTFSATLTLAVGVHSLTATQTLNAVTSAASAAVSLTIAPNPPTITSPPSGFSTTNPSVIVTGTGMPGASVAVLDGTATVGTGTADGAGNFSLSITLAVGAHSLTATQTLNAVTSAASAGVTVIIQLPPVVITDNETITVTDAESFPDVFATETVKVSDQVTVYAFFPIAISPAPPILSAVQNQPYPGVTFSGSGGYQSLTLSESGVVPGMSFAIVGASATFSGTPTQAGTFPFTITATDSIGNKLSQNYSLTVSATCPAISVSPSGSLGTLTVGNPFSQTFVASGGVGTTIWSTASALPVGMNFSGGVLSGSPGQSGTFVLTITAADQNGCQGSSNVSLLVVPPPAVITDNETITVTDAVSFPDVFDRENVKVTDQVTVHAFFPIAISPAPPILSAVQNQPYSGVTFSGSGGYQSLTLSESGVVPGMTFAINGASALFSGTPTQAGTFPFSITATDSVGNALNQNYSLVVAASCPAISVSPSGSLGTVTIGNPFSQTFVASGGVGTTTWSTPSVLPAGINFSGGVLYGNPTQSGTFALTLAATDQNGCRGSSNVSLLVVPPPAVITDNETITVTDTASFPDMSASEQISVTDQVSVQVLDATTTSISLNGAAVFGVPVSVTVSVSSPTAAVTGKISLSVDGGPAVTSLLSSGSATFNPGNLSILGNLSVGPHVLAANFPAQANFLGSSAGMKFAVAKATPTITWANPAAITYGTALSSAQLNATASAPGAFTYNPAAGAVLTAGSQTLSVAFTPTDATDYTTASATVTLQVNQATPTVTWANPPAITYGTALSATQLNATASVAGLFTYSPPAGTVLSAGSQTLSVKFNPTDSTDYTPLAASVTLQVNLATPVITWANPAPIIYGTALSSTQLNATASVPGAFLYSPAAGTVLTAGSQTLVAAFTPVDTTNYTAAKASVTLQVKQATPTISWANPPAITYGTALSGKQLNATASVNGTFVYNPAAGTVLTAGSQTLTVVFVPSDTTDYTKAGASVILQVNQATPTITWANPAPIIYGTALGSTELNATASVPGAFSYSPAAGTVLTTGSQTLVAAFTPVDTINYTAAKASVTLQVKQATPTISWKNPAPITYGTPLGSAQLNAIASVPGSFVYSPAVGTVLTAGNQPLSVTFTPTDTTDYTTATATVTLQVNQATPTITWANPPAITFGTALSGKQLNATASVPGTLVYNPVAGTVLGAGSQTLSVVFAPNDKVDYTKAAGSVTLVVNQATPTITWANPAPITLGTPLSSTQLNATASVSGVSLPGTFVYNPPLKTVLGAGTQTLSVTFTPADSKDYQTVTQSVSITVNVSGSLTVQSGQTYTFSNGSISGNVTLNGGTLTLIGSTVGGSLTMSSGSLTLDKNSTVSNNVQIQGGSFSIRQASIKGNLQITNVPAGKTPGVVCGASVSGDLQFQYNAIPGQIGQSSCLSNKIGGNLQITNNTAPLQIFKNAVGGNLQVQSNTGSAQVFQNTVQNLLQCSGNSSPFTGGNNTAASKQGQCANF